MNSTSRRSNPTPPGSRSADPGLAVAPLRPGGGERKRANSQDTGVFAMMRLIAAAALALTLSTAALAEAASITPTVVQAAGLSSAPVNVITWSGMAGADTPVSAPAGHCADLTVQITRTFGTTTVTLQGSMDDVNYSTL